jgi:hypothetical protein
MSQKYEVGDLVVTPAIQYGVIIGWENFSFRYPQAVIFVPGRGEITCSEHLLRLVDESR